MKEVLSILFFVITFLSYAQNSKVRFGIQGGVNYSGFYGYEKQTFINNMTFSERPGFALLGGLYLNFQIKKKLSLKTELNYERKNQKVDIDKRVYPDPFNGEVPMEPYKEYRYTVTRRYDYLVLPLLLKYDFKNINSFYVNGGPYVGYLLNAKSFNDANDDSAHDDTEYFKRIDFGLSAGLGKNFDLTKSRLFIEFRSNFGLTDVNDKATGLEGELKTNSLNLLLGYSFD